MKELDPGLRQPHNLTIATVGEVVLAEEAEFIIRAADELNLTLETPRFNVVVDDMPEETRRVKIEGEWEDIRDLTPFWERVEEIMDELA